MTFEDRIFILSKSYNPLYLPNIVFNKKNIRSHILIWKCRVLQALKRISPWYTITNNDLDRSSFQIRNMYLIIVCHIKCFEISQP